MGPKWLSHLTYAKQMVRARWGGSSQVPAYRGKDRGLHQETRILSHPQTCSVGKASWDAPRIFAPKPQSPATDEPDPERGQGRAPDWEQSCVPAAVLLQPLSCLADSVPPSPPSLARPRVGLELGTSRGESHWQGSLLK